MSEQNEEITGKGLTQQAYRISRRIPQVDFFLRRTDRAAARDKLVEPHPEVCFRAFAGQHLQHSKTSAPGFGERLTARSAVLDAPETIVREVSAELMESAAYVEVDIDDVNAVALAAAASGPEAELHELPQDPPNDTCGLPQRIAY